MIVDRTIKEFFFLTFESYQGEEVIFVLQLPLYCNRICQNIKIHCIINEMRYNLELLLTTIWFLNRFPNINENDDLNFSINILRQF